MTFPPPAALEVPWVLGVFCCHCFTPPRLLCAQPCKGHSLSNTQHLLKRNFKEVTLRTRSSLRKHRVRNLAHSSSFHFIFYALDKVTKEISSTCLSIIPSTEESVWHEVNTETNINKDECHAIIFILLLMACHAGKDN